jgi:hypothetical protein
MEIMMRKLALAFAAALFFCGGANAQSSTQELKNALDQAMRTIQDLQQRVRVLEEQNAKAAPTASAPAPAAPVVAPGSNAVSKRFQKSRTWRYFVASAPKFGATFCHWPAARLILTRPLPPCPAPYPTPYTISG